MKTHAITLLALLAGAPQLAAQVRLDRPLVLTAPSDSARRVMGLADAVDTTDALNARSAARGLFRTATATGTPNAWTAALAPALADTPTVGMELLLRIPQMNTGTVTLAVDGIGPFPVEEAPGDGLDSADVPAGLVARLLFDGAAFQLVNGRAPRQRPCPPGFVAVTEQFCIEPDQRDTLDFRDAAMVCGALGARLCTWGEFYAACTRAAQLGLNNMTGDWEWTNNSANADMGVRVVGYSSCTIAATSGALDPPARNFRCCFRH
ncbi:MAG: hypothetical protein IT228_03790 [Flavobacteriales bacterium]|nr:hypothetical protein [Flavobacteriales bacterium]MCC6576443.1 hypothetical protein [Flavobacteriales bacterium]NUQ16063.1 hypothetical protein [Flavobacteriales bacterium]